MKPVSVGIVIASSVLAFIAAYIYRQRPDAPQVDSRGAYVAESRPGGEYPAIDRTGTGLTPVSAPAPAPDASQADPAEVRREPASDSAEELSAFVEWKYRFLLADLRLDGPTTARLKRLLSERERLARAIAAARAENAPAAADALARLQAELAAVERQLASLLDRAAYAHFELLKDSDTEQQHLAQYTGGISNVAPLGARNERAVLEAKLRHKKGYERILRDSGIDRERLSAEERAYAHAAVVQALNEYRDNFLMEVRPLLSEEQYILLSNYEATELERELRRLQILINAK